jgi:cyclopropane fatty-acyl-phospholipid synthase-like methyltransferase
LERFLANRGALPPRYDARFQRMWEYYLSCCIAAATAGEVALYQVLLGNDFAGDRPWARV